ncbi:hypothetical protein [Clostridium sp.]|uniref:hypothetical protein n=1 Tax=Clostridium sp. TaxID=1506 RepID=UPI002848D92B|nr:hypothetical protein [Clostridium sp.]MDR3593590.1 hypothetical protein [Clostridium sp.]
MIKLKRTIIYIIILTLSIMLFGCGDVYLNSLTAIDDNESGSVKLQIIYDDIIGSKLKKDIFDHKWVNENGYIFNKYSQGNMNVEEITYSFKNIKELEEKINSSGLATMTYSKKAQMREKINSIQLNFNKSNIDNLIKNSTGNDEKIYNYINNIKIHNEVKVPGKIVKSNTSVEVNENTRKWTYKLSQIDNNTSMSFSYR